MKARVWDMPPRYRMLAGVEQCSPVIPLAPVGFLGLLQLQRRRRT